LGNSVLPGLITVSDELNPAQLRSANNRFDIARLSTAAPTIRSANLELTRSIAAVGHLPKSTWLGQVDEARSSVADSLNKLSSTLSGIDEATQIAPNMLGQSGKQRYFVGLMNDAESRGIGGMPGSFAIVEADQGTLTFEHFGSDSELDGVSVPNVVSSAFAAHYAYRQPFSRYIWSDISPNFPSGAKIWAAMWQKKTGQAIDGAVALDPTALSYFLAQVGSVTAADGTHVTSQNVVALTQSTLYAKYPALSDQDQRKSFLIDLSSAVDTKILSSKNTPGLLKAAGQAANDRRLLLWSANPSTEAVIARTNLSGIIPVTKSPFIGPLVTSGTGNKLDYYIARDISVTRFNCGPYTRVLASIRLTNSAPASGLSSYVTSRVDKTPYKVNPGDQRDDVSYFATEGAKLNFATLDGVNASVRTDSEQGHPTFLVDVEIPRGKSRTVQFDLTEPSSDEVPIQFRQPGVEPFRQTVTEDRCS
jgi:hypothetical protein